MKIFFKDHEPDIVIHAANNPSAGWCEEYPDKAVALNQQATEEIVALCNEHKTKLLYISSVVAFRPENIYGKTKKASEDHIIAHCTDYCILRPSLIVGYSPNTVNDRPFNRFLKNLDTGSKAVYDNSWKFQPTSLAHLSAVVKEVVLRSAIEEPIYVACPGLVTRYKVAKDLLEPFGVAVEAAETADSSPIINEPVSGLENLGLATRSYDQLVFEIIDEIRHRDKYSLR